MNALQLDRSLRSNDDRLSASAYQLLLGGLLTYGLALTALICTLFGDTFYYLSGGSSLLFLLGYILCVFLSVVLNSSGSAVVNLVGYHLLVLPIGAVLSVAVTPATLTDIRSAIIGTVIFLIIMIAASCTRPELFYSLGQTLGTALIATLIAEIALFFLGISQNWTNYLMTAIFSLYLGYDWSRATSCAPTVRNAILSASQIYLDIINLFIRLLDILRRARDD